MRKIDEITLNKLKGIKIAKPNLKNIIGGCDPTYEGGELPGVTITCGASRGKCWDFGNCVYSWTPFGPISVTTCYFTGLQKHFCEPNMPC